MERLPDDSHFHEPLLKALRQLHEGRSSQESYFAVSTVAAEAGMAVQPAGKALQELAAEGLTFNVGTPRRKLWQLTEAGWEQTDTNEGR